MRTVFMFSLGPNRYSEASYDDVDPTADNPFDGRFFPALRLRALNESRARSELGPIDHLYALLTPTAKDSNWNGDEGLAADLHRQGYTEGKNLTIVHLTDPATPDDIWTIYHRLKSVVQRNDSIYADVTNGFRVLPFMMNAVLDFVALNNGAEVVEVIYGAFEMKDSVSGRSKMIDLLPVLRVGQWSALLSAFKETGDLRPVALEFAQFVRDHKRRTRAPAGTLEAMSSKLDRLAMCLAESRMRQIPATAHELALLVSESVQTLEQHAELLPLADLLHSLVEDIRPFALSKGTIPEKLLAQVALCEWLASNGLYMQSYTVIRETLVDIICALSDSNPFDDNESRKAAESISNQHRKLSQQRSEAGGDNAAPEHDEIHAKLSSIRITAEEREFAFSALFNRVCDERNSYLHGHTITPSRNSGAQISQALEKHARLVRALIEQEVRS